MSQTARPELPISRSRYCQFMNASMTWSHASISSKRQLKCCTNLPEFRVSDVPPYNWWNEGLHGVARAGIATVFPQAIGLAAMFDADLHFRIAVVISDEARAKHHEFLRQGDHGMYKGLTVWSPNINIFRDPRWGRGHETYGECPYLTARLGVAFCKGLQGEDPKYLKAIATPKHYAAHSGPEGLRHGFDAVVSPKDLRETYLPAFHACITEARALIASWVRTIGPMARCVAAAQRCCRRFYATSGASRASSSAIAGPSKTFTNRTR